MKKAKTLQGLRSTSAHDLLLRPFQPRQMLLEPWLRTEETSVIWAPSGVGKTMLCLSIALAIAGGGSVGDWKAPSPRRVLYIDGEMHIQDIKERLELLAEPAMGILNHAQRDEALRNLEIIARQDQEISAPFYDLGDPETHSEIIQRLNNTKADLVILDNFTTLSDGLEDENAATAFKGVQDFFLRLKRCGVGVILVHHANKGGKEMRGSTALATTFEVILGLKHPAVRPHNAARFVATFDKFRGQGDARLEPREWTLGEHGWQVVEQVPDDPREDRYYKALKSLRFTNNAEIADELGVHRSSVKRGFDRLVALGIISQDEIVECFRKAKELRKVEHNGLPDYDFPFLDDETGVESELADEEF
jgi:hypothetical protein